MAADGGFPRGVPWFFDHAETVSHESLDRIAALGGALSVQNRMMFQGRVFVDRYGAELAASAPPIRAMMDRGLHVAAGTDATRASSYNPWLSLYWLVTGRTIDDVTLRAPDSHLDRETALTMYTSAGAALSGETDKKGRIAVGQYADLAVLSADFFSVPVEEISRIESLLTIVGGKVVYGALDFAGADVPLPEISPAWSPVALFGGYQQRADGVTQATRLIEAALDSAEQRQFREASGELRLREFGIGNDPLACDLFGCGDL